ncbi:hypothetical protein RUND412_001253 [Rhizina undulata]
MCHFKIIKYTGCGCELKFVTELEIAAVLPDTRERCRVEFADVRDAITMNMLVREADGVLQTLALHPTPSKTTSNVGTSAPESPKYKGLHHATTIPLLQHLKIAVAPELTAIILPLLHSLLEATLGSRMSCLTVPAKERLSPGDRSLLCISLYARK